MRPTRTIPDRTAELPVVSNSTAVLSLRRPFGRVLVGKAGTRRGAVKTVENRRSYPPFFGWFLVLSSAAAPKKADIEEVKRNLLAADGNLDRLCGYGESQSVLGWILVSDAYEGSRGDPWEHEGDVHWVVSDSIAFAVPVPRIRGVQSLYRFVRSMSEDERARLLAAAV
jgi:hypothetical protein